ncbi:hypothetical protein OAO01_07490 [Oligoflexia bacterium]|nr:hypothetical protein [Oligoflexia bacterium]
MELEGVNCGSKYELVLEGLKEDTPEALRQLKGILITEFSLSIDEVKAILDNFPATLQHASSKDEVQDRFKLLHQAGANVSMIDSESGETVTCTQQEKSTPEEEVVEEFEFDIDIIAEEDLEPLKRKPKAPKVYTLDVDTETVNVAEEETDPEIDGEIHDLLSELKSKTLVEASPQLLNKGILTPNFKADVAKQDPAQAESTPPVLEAGPAPVVEPRPFTETVEPDQDIDIESTAAVIDDTVKHAVSEIVLDAPVDIDLGNATEKSTFFSSKFFKISTSGRLMSIPLQIMVTIVLAISIPYVSNHYFRNQASSASERVAKSMVLLDRMEEAAQLDHSTATIIKNSPLVIGKKEFKDQRLRVEFTVEQKKLTAISMLLTTPHPPQTEATQGDDEVPWMQKVIAKDLLPKLYNDGEFSSSGSATVFFKHQSVRKKLPADISVTGVFNSKKGEIEATFEILRGRFYVSPGDAPVIEKTKNGTYRISARAKITVKLAEAGK